MDAYLRSIVAVPVVLALIGVLGVIWALEQDSARRGRPTPAARSLQPGSRDGALRGPKARFAALIVIALVAGLVGGVVLSEVIAIVSYLFFRSEVGIRFLPFYLALAAAIAVTVVEIWARRGSK